MIQFSIIIPTYNASRCLSKALDSLLTQTWERYEIIIVDGGSTDGTQEIVESYQVNFKGRLSCISEKDAGIYDAMNKGITRASGEWIYFLGSDDILYDNTVLETVSVYIGNSPRCDILYGDVLMGRGKRILGGEFTGEKLIKKNICHQAIFFQKDVFSIIGYYDIRYVSYADWVHNMRWFNSSRITHQYIPIIVAQYALGGHSNTVFDAQFYKDIASIVKANFTEEDVAFFERFRGREIRFITNKFRWMVWEFKNKIFFVLFSPIDFVRKYFL